MKQNNEYLKNELLSIEKAKTRNEAEYLHVQLKQGHIEMYKLANRFTNNKTKQKNRLLLNKKLRTLDFALEAWMSTHGIPHNN